MSLLLFYKGAGGGGTQTISPSLYTNSNTFFAPTVAAGTVTLSPSRYDNANTFYAVTVTPGAITLSPARYDNANTFYSPTVSSGANNISPARYDNAQTYYSATVTAGAVTLQPALYQNAQAFYTPDVTDAATIAPELYTNQQAFYQPVVTQQGGAQTLLPGLYVNTQDFYSATVEVLEYEAGKGWIPQLKRKRKWREEADEREQLRSLIKRAIDPVTESAAKVVTVKGEVAVVTKSQAIPIPVPPRFDAQAVARMVVSVLEAQGIEAQRARDAKIRQRALLALEAERAKNERRLRKRRRDEEILLLT